MSFSPQNKVEEHVVSTDVVTIETEPEVSKRHIIKIFQSGIKKILLPLIFLMYIIYNSLVARLYLYVISSYG